MGHRRLQQSLVVPSSFDKLFVQLCKVILLLRVLLDQLDKLGSNRKSLVVKLGNLLVIFLSGRCVGSAQQCEELLNVLDLSEHLGLHLSLAL